MEEEKLICLLADEETVTGFLLAGVGQRDAKGANFLVVDAKTPRETVESTFTGFAGRPDVGLILISAPIADSIRPLISAHAAGTKIPMVIEIPSKDAPAGDMGSDPLMRRVMQLLGES